MEKLTEIERLAGLLFSVYEIGLLTGRTPTTAGDAFEQAMLRGRLGEEAEAYAAVLNRAKAGDSSAQCLAWQFTDQLRPAA